MKTHILTLALVALLATNMQPFSSMYAKHAIGKVTISDRIARANLWYSWNAHHYTREYVSLGLRPVPRGGVVDPAHCATASDGGVNCKVRLDKDYV